MWGYRSGDSSSMARSAFSRMNDSAFANHGSASVRISASLRRMRFKMNAFSARPSSGSRFAAANCFEHSSAQLPYSASCCSQTRPIW